MRELKSQIAKLSETYEIQRLRRSCIASSAGRRRTWEEQNAVAPQSTNNFCWASSCTPCKRTTYKPATEQPLYRVSVRLLHRGLVSLPP